MIPKNEQDLVYLFARNHEFLGFEKIVRFDPHGTPDCIALRNGKEIGIELEYKLKGFCRHYFKEKFSPKKLFDYKTKNGRLLIFRKESPDRIEKEFSTDMYEVWDPTTFPISPSILIDDFHTSQPVPLVIISKTMFHRVQCIVCWEKNFELKDNIEIIECKNLNFSR